MVSVLESGPVGPTLERHVDGQLWATRGGQSRAVRVARCFPWSAPGRYISLRDEHREEFLLVADPGALDRRSRQALEDALVEADFVLEIEAIVSVTEEIEIRDWRVVTRQGPRAFQTRRDEWPRRVPGGGILVRDVAGDLFHIGDSRKLGRRSRELLATFID
jgi:hypothetical protein